MIVEDANIRFSPTEKKRYIDNGVIMDSCVLLVFFLDEYVKTVEGKQYILKRCNITKNQITCLNTIITNFHISQFIVTPYIFSEFLNRIRKDLKEDYKEIKKQFIQELKNMGEIRPLKNEMLEHKSFFDFGNDVSLFLATEEQLKKNKYSCIISFDGRFIQEFFNNSTDKLLAFNLGTLQHYYNS